MTGNNYVLKYTQDIILGCAHGDICRKRWLCDKRSVTAINAPDFQYGMHTCKSKCWKNRYRCANLYLLL